MSFKHRLERLSQEPLEQSFKKFRLGAAIFFCGMLVVYLAAKMLTPSLAQEWVTLAGLVLVGLGFGLALLAQARMLLARLLRFWKKPE